MTDLRERRHLEIKHQLVETAFDLFAQRGFTNVSTAEVAQAAGVSRSTLYRRFPTKDDLVLEIPKRWMVVFDQAVDALPQHTSMADAIGGPVRAVATHIDQNQEIVRTAFRLLEQSPTLQQTGLAATAWLGRIAALFRRFSSAGEELSLVLAGAYFGAIDAMVLHWATTDGSASVTEMTSRLLERLEPILPTDTP